MVSTEEKASIRWELLKGLADTDSKIRTAVALAIASIACTDLPQDWPDLIGTIVEAISSHANPALVSGSVRCLSLFVEELDEDPLVQVSYWDRTSSLNSKPFNVGLLDGVAPIYLITSVFVVIKRLHKDCVSQGCGI